MTSEATSMHKYYYHFWDVSGRNLFAFEMQIVYHDHHCEISRNYIYFLCDYFGHWERRKRDCIARIHWLEILLDWRAHAFWHAAFHRLGFTVTHLSHKTWHFIFSFLILLFFRRRRRNVVMHHRPCSYLYFILIINVFPSPNPQTPGSLAVTDLS